MPFEDGRDYIGIAISLYLSTALLYYFVLEMNFQRTLGKYITKTKVITEDNQKPGLKQIGIRTVSRLIPIDALSFVFKRKGLHDQLSNTKLVKC